VRVYRQLRLSPITAFQTTPIDVDACTYCVLEATAVWLLKKASRKREPVDDGGGTAARGLTTQKETSPDSLHLASHGNRCDAPGHSAGRIVSALRRQTDAPGHSIAQGESGVN